MTDARRPEDKSIAPITSCIARPYSTRSTYHLTFQMRSRRRYASTIGLLVVILFKPSSFVTGCTKSVKTGRILSECSYDPVRVASVTATPSGHSETYSSNLEYNLLESSQLRMHILSQIIEKPVQARSLCSIPFQTLTSESSILPAQNEPITRTCLRVSFTPSVRQLHVVRIDPMAKL